MSPIYMTVWSLAIIGALGIWRLNQWQHVVAVTLVTLLIVFFSQTLFVQLAFSAGVTPEHAFAQPALFLEHGPFGWLALLVMPCGWLGPIVGFNLVRRWQQAE